MEARRSSPLTPGQLATRVSYEELGTASAPSPDVLDTDLIQKSLDGDFAAFEGLVARYERRVFWIAFQVLGKVEESRDVVQEAFVRIYRMLDRFDFTKSFYTWLYTIVTNLAIDSHRKLRKRPTVQLDDQADGVEDANPDFDPTARYETKERADLVREVLEGLPEMFRTALTLRDLQGLSCRQIAAVTGLTHATVRWRLHRARQLFKERWGRMVK